MAGKIEITSGFSQAFAKAADFHQEAGFIPGKSGSGQGKLQLLKDGPGFAGDVADDLSDVFHYALTMRQGVRHMMSYAKKSCG